jgi:hypothetical protein
VASDLHQSTHVARIFEVGRARTESVPLRSRLRAPTPAPTPTPSRRRPASDAVLTHLRERLICELHLLSTTRLRKATSFAVSDLAAQFRIRGGAGWRGHLLSASG